MNSKVWIGLLGVKPKNANIIIGGAAGAYTNILACAQTEDQFIKKVKLFLEDNFLEFIEIEDVEPFQERIANYSVDQELVDLAKVVLKMGETRIGTLDTYDSEEESEND